MGLPAGVWVTPDDYLTGGSPPTAHIHQLSMVEYLGELRRGLLFHGVMAAALTSMHVCGGLNYTTTSIKKFWK